MISIQLTERQERIMEIVRNYGPIKGEEIADRLGLVRSTLRPDLAILTKTGFLEARPRVGYYVKEGYTSFLSESIKDIKVKDMKSVPPVVDLNTTVYDAIVTLFLMDAGSLFVVSEGGLLEGVVSRKDLLKGALGKMDLHEVPISVIMTRMPNVITVTPEETLWSAAQKLVEHEIDSLPVVRASEHKGRQGLEVIGKISKTTITKAFFEMGEGTLDEGGRML